MIDLSSYPNVFNSYNNKKKNKGNPWELFFNQPFGFKIEKVKKKAKHVHYFECTFPFKMINHRTFYQHKQLILFWHDIFQKYIPIKNEIIKQAHNFQKQFFKLSKNVLGILMRGTDYISRKPKFHPIPPKISDVFKDIKKMEKIFRYDYLFIATEDNIIRNKFIKEFGNKMKYIQINKIYEYNYQEKKFLSLNKNIIGNLYYIKLYLINIILLSKCIDVITARTNGSIGLFIITEGFRNVKIYFLGEYK